MLIPYPTSIAPESLKVLIDFGRGGGDPKALAHVAYHDLGFFLGVYYADTPELHVGAELQRYNYEAVPSAVIAEALETELARLGGSEANDAGETVRATVPTRDLVPTAHLDPAVRAMLFELVKRAIPFLLKLIV